MGDYEPLRPLCGKKHGENRKSQGAGTATMRVSGLGQSPIVPSFLKGGEKMAKRENVLEKLIGKTTRPEGELEAIDRRLHMKIPRGALTGF